MRTLLITLAIFVSSFIQAQDRYDLFIRHGKGIRFTEPNDLSRLNQIYYVDSDDSCLVIYNHYLRFETINNKTKVSFLGLDDGTFNTQITKLDGFWYILRFEVNDKFVYYYFYRRFDFLENIWTNQTQ
jgi:hypothetical protein